MSKWGKGKTRFSREELLEALGGIADEILQATAELDADEIVQQAAAALEEYDYEKTYDLYKAAVLKAEGEAEYACKLATFLVDDYAHFEQAIALLSSASCAVSDESERLLARSLFMAGQKAEALQVYERINKRGGDGLSWKRQGILQMESGRFADAVAALAKTLELTPSDSEADRMMSECKAARETELRPVLVEVGTMIADGEFSPARERLDELAQQGWLPPEYYRTRKRLDSASSELKLTAMLDQGAALEERDELQAALDVFQAALKLDPKCELAKERVLELEARLVRHAATSWLTRGNRQFAEANIEGAIHDYFMATTRGATKADVEPAAAGLFAMVQEYQREIGKMPTSAQLQSLESLFHAVTELDKGNVERARMLSNRSGTLLDQLASGRLFRDRLASKETDHSVQQANEWAARAFALEQEGNLEGAVRFYERAGQVEQFGARAAALAAAKRLSHQLRTVREQDSILRHVEELVEKGAYFLALREIDGAGDMAAGIPMLGQLETRAREGVASKYPLDVSTFEHPGLGDSKEYRSGKDGLEGFLPESTRILNASPLGREVYLLSGARLVLLDAQELRPVLQATLPPQADLTDKKGFALYGLATGDRNALVFVNFDDDLLLYFTQKRTRLDLNNAMPLARSLRQSRQKVSRWFTLNGREETLMVCQSAPGVASAASLYTLSLYDGKLVQSEDYGYALSHLRRLSGEDNLYVAHRYPEPAQMRRSGYFSYLYMDGRLRVTERHHIPHDELDGTFLESTRWVRFGPITGRRYSLFRYYDAFSGQLVGRPLAFVAMETAGTLLFGAPDSSTLVRNAGDLDPMGEVFVRGGREHLVVAGRKKDDQKLFVVNLDGFKLEDTIDVPDKYALVGLARGKTETTTVSILLNKKTGEIVMQERDLG